MHAAVHPCTLATRANQKQQHHHPRRGSRAEYHFVDGKFSPHLHERPHRSLRAVCLHSPRTDDRIQDDETKLLFTCIHTHTRGGSSTLKNGNIPANKMPPSAAGQRTNFGRFLLWCFILGASE